jgi:hypothetical protein
MQSVVVTLMLHTRRNVAVLNLAALPTSLHFLRVTTTSRMLGRLSRAETWLQLVSRPQQGDDHLSLMNPKV